MTGIRRATVSLVAVSLLGALPGSAMAFQGDRPLSAAAASTSTPQFAKNRTVREQLNALGKCLATVRSVEVRSFLLNPSERNWHPVTYYRNEDAPCVGQYVFESDTSMFRGAVAEGWYLANFPKAPPAAFSDGMNPPPAQEEVVARIAAAKEGDRNQVVIDEFARCVAMVAPVGIDALMRSPVATETEAKAVSALSASFSSCVFEGQKLSLNPESLRAALAFALATRAAREA